MSQGKIKKIKKPRNQWPSVTLLAFRAFLSKVESPRSLNPWVAAGGREAIRIKDACFLLQCCMCFVCSFWGSVMRTTTANYGHNEYQMLNTQSGLVNDDVTKYRIYGHDDNNMDGNR